MTQSYITNHISAMFGSPSPPCSGCHLKYCSFCSLIQACLFVLLKTDRRVEHNPRDCRLCCAWCRKGVQILTCLSYEKNDCIQTHRTHSNLYKGTRGLKHFAFFFFFFDISVWCLPLPTTFSKTIPLENQFGNKFFHPVPLFVEVQFSYNLWNLSDKQLLLFRG